MYAYYLSEHPEIEDAKAVFAITVANDDLSSFSKEVQIIKERDELQKLADGLDVIIDGVTVNWDAVAAPDSANNAPIETLAELGFPSIGDAVLHLIQSLTSSPPAPKGVKK